jgi:hypothetical protein
MGHTINCIGIFVSLLFPTGTLQINCMFISDR